MKQIIRRATKDGYDTVVINYRGLAGAELTTPELYCIDSYEDILEPMKHFYGIYSNGS